MTPRFAAAALTSLGLAWCATIALAAEPEAPKWIRWGKLSAGGTFVTDGAMTLDSAIAKPAKLPESELHASSVEIVERHLAAEHPERVRLADLERRGNQPSYRAPSGLTLAAKYVEYLRHVAPSAELRIKGDLDPVVILFDGKPVGLVMAMKRTE